MAERNMFRNLDMILTCPEMELQISLPSRSGTAED